MVKMRVILVGFPLFVLGLNPGKLFSFPRFSCGEGVIVSRDSSQDSYNVGSLKKIIAKGLFSLFLASSILSPGSVRAEDELAAYAAQGHEVGVDGQCFMKKCALETSRCANNPNCLKGLACLAR
jgi:hypothetical protein